MPIDINNADLPAGDSREGGWVSNAMRDVRMTQTSSRSFPELPIFSG